MSRSSLISIVRNHNGEVYGNKSSLLTTGKVLKLNTVSSMETLNSTLGETSYRVELIKSAEEGWKRYNSVKSSTTLSSERSNALVQTKSLAHLHSTSSITRTTSPQSTAPLQTIKIEDQQ
jgi:hypothetical protein